jgi:hypothetical protein
LPAIVPRFWIWAAPTSRAATFSASKAGGRSALAISLHVVVAPMRTASTSTRAPRSAELETST